MRNTISQTQSEAEFFAHLSIVTDGLGYCEIAHLLIMFQLIISQTARERAKLAEHLSSMESDNDLCLDNRKGRL